MEDEQYEHIPWSQLGDGNGPRWRPIVYGIAVVVGAIVVGVVVARWLAAPGHGEAAEPSTTPPSSAAPDAPPSTIAGDVAAAQPTTSAALTEADLMASIPSPKMERAVRMRAEWFVTDYFTVDGDPEAAGEIESSFVEDAVVPELPHTGSDPEAISFVEWARAFDVEPLDEHRYAVDVAFRSVHRDESGEFRRGPVHAVQIRLVVGEGTVGVADLPIPIVAPHSAGLSGWSVPAGEADDEVIAAAADYAFLFDAAPEVVEASGTMDEWRAVVTVGDGSGIRWPLAVLSDAVESHD